jgi:hypothetical protein
MVAMVLLGLLSMWVGEKLQKCALTAGSHSLWAVTSNSLCM